MYACSILRLRPCAITTPAAELLSGFLRDDLSGMQLSGKKVRKLGFLLADAVPQGADCIITVGGIQSNHRRATAIAARYLNLDTYLILRTAKRLVNKDPGLAGILLVERLVGAHVELISREEYAEIGSVCAICSLEDVDVVKQGRITISGYAVFGGGCGIERINISVDGGKTWVEAYRYQKCGIPYLSNDINSGLIQL